MALGAILKPAESTPRLIGSGGGFRARAARGGGCQPAALRASCCGPSRRRWPPCSRPPALGRAPPRGSRECSECSERAIHPTCTHSDRPDLQANDAADRLGRGLQLLFPGALLIEVHAAPKLTGRASRPTWPMRLGRSRWSRWSRWSPSRVAIPAPPLTPGFAEPSCTAAATRTIQHAGVASRGALATRGAPVCTWGSRGS